MHVPLLGCFDLEDPNSMWLRRDCLLNHTQECEREIKYGARKPNYCTEPHCPFKTLWLDASHALFGVVIVTILWGGERDHPGLFI